jgi:hypothetical protein
MPKLWPPRNPDRDGGSPVAELIRKIILRRKKPVSSSQSGVPALLIVDQTVVQDNKKISGTTFVIQVSRQSSFPPPPGRTESTLHRAAFFCARAARQKSLYNATMPRESANGRWFVIILLAVAAIASIWAGLYRNSHPGPATEPDQSNGF